ncbi:hypothetical protein NPIL_340971, partial [Nephila pilipes]
VSGHLERGSTSCNCGDDLWTPINLLGEFSCRSKLKSAYVLKELVDIPSGMNKGEKKAASHPEEVPQQEKKVLACNKPQLVTALVPLVTSSVGLGKGNGNPRSAEFSLSNNKAKPNDAQQISSRAPKVLCKSDDDGFISPSKTSKNATSNSV